jgi:hypothetical protein
MDAFRATALITVRRLLCDPTMSEVPCPAGRNLSASYRWRYIRFNEPLIL